MTSNTNNRDKWFGIALLIASAVGIAFVFKEQSKHIEQDAKVATINRELSERTRILEVENEGLVKQLDSCKNTPPIQLPPQVITVVKKVPASDWWIAEPVDTIIEIDTVFGGWGIPIDIDSIQIMRHN